MTRARSIVLAVLGLGAFCLGAQIEVSSVDAGQGFAYSRVAPVHALAVVLICLAVDQLRRWRRHHPQRAVIDWPVPAWQGYGAVAVGGGFIALAGATWFLSDLKSITLALSFIGMGALIAVGGVGVVRAAAPKIVPPPFPHGTTGER